MNDDEIVMPRRHTFEDWVAALGMVLMLVLVCVEITKREFFNSSFLWSEEVARYLMIWSVYFGASAAVASSSHLRIDMLINMVPRRVRRVLDIFAQVWVCAFSLAITYAGYRYVQDSFSLGFVSADSNLPLQMGWIQLVIPITFALSAFHALRQLSKLIATDTASPKEI
ncbi:MAG: TRAP transporter small permease [Xanthobacteraceae bacterium]|nr:TRAP transporter small permease [Xanthobacteraceae bacterium]